MKQDDVREDWEKEYESIFFPATGYTSADVPQLLETVRSYIRSLLASHSTSLLQKMEGLRKVCSAIENDESAEGCDCLAHNNAIEGCIAIVKEKI